MKEYIALFEYVNRENSAQGYSVVFPDFPGLVTAGKNYDETYKMAHEGLSSHIKYLESKNIPIPEPRSIEQIETTWEDWPEWKADNDFLVTSIAHLPVTTKAKRINIFINEGLLAQIDRVAKNRSEYISQVVELSFR